MIARRIGDLPFAVYGPARRTGRSLPWIVLDDTMAHLNNAKWVARAMQEEQAGPPALIVNDSEVILHSICAGLGRSVLPCFIADRERGVRRLSGATPVLSRELWLLVNPELRHLARIKVVVAWIEQIVNQALSAD